MIAPRRVAAALVAMLLALGLALAALSIGERRGEAPTAHGKRSELLLLSSLPLVFGEGFGLESTGSPALSRLQERYRVTPISAADARSLSGKELLLMAQPNAQTAEALVELDQWVRGGGRVLLLADPVLEWPSELPLGDVRRPAMSFADTGLLGHWGLRLDSPKRLGPHSFAVDGKPVHALSPGILRATGKACRVNGGAIVARCRIGEGKATVIADADFIDVERRREPTRSVNLDALIVELERLKR